MPISLSPEPGHFSWLIKEPNKQPPQLSESSIYLFSLGFIHPSPGNPSGVTSNNQKIVISSREFRPFSAWP